MAKFIEILVGKYLLKLGVDGEIGHQLIKPFAEPIV